MAKKFGQVRQVTTSGGTRVEGLGGARNIDRQSALYEQNHVVEGLWVTPQATPDTTVDVSAGKVRINGTIYNVSASSGLDMTAAHASLARYDIVQVNTSGTIARKGGTAAASPVVPLPDANNIRLCTVTRAANDNAVGSADINNDTRPKLGATDVA